ncbi:salicylic acid-binding protein 2-like [Macadamia integrifolia]|nr:salicylic acid-binding protein 2-like [Macadamia integrifolia]
MLVAVVVVLLQLNLVVNGQSSSQPKHCNFTQTPRCLKNVTGLGHVVLVHGIGQGEWYWYKVKPILEAGGYNVTTIQLGPSVTSPVNSIKNVTFWNYSQPLFDLMDCINHSVFIVSHSAGGFNMAVAMEKYPKKIRAAVFVAAYMPDTAHNMSYVLDEQPKYPPDSDPHWEDTCTVTSGNNKWYFFGGDFLSDRLYERATTEDIALLYTQRRPASFFENELAKIQLSNDSYGSLDRYYILTGSDLALLIQFQRHMVSEFPVKDQMFIKRAGHEVMLSKPILLCGHLFDIFRRYGNLSDEKHQLGTVWPVKISAKPDSI